MDQHHPSARRAAAVAAGTGLAYYLLASLMWQIDTTWGSAFWPAAGVTFAVLVRSPRAWWPAILVVIAAVEAGANLQHGTGIGTAVWGGTANAVEPLIGASLFRAATGARRLRDLRSLGWLVAGGAVAGPAVGALFGGLLAVQGPSPALTRWVRWFVGDGVGVIAVAPALLSTVPQMRGRAREVLAVAGALGVAGTLLVVPAGDLGAVGPYLAVPVLMWASLRFGVLGAAVGSSVVATVVHAATATGHGAFVESGSGALVVAQTYIGAVAVSALTVAILVEDIASRRLNEQLLLHRALHDPLTGLPNRAQLQTSLAEEPVGAVVAVDLDGFKAVNDDHGHAVGDAVLQVVAQRLKAVCRPEDVVARVGGDEFVVLLRGIVTGEALAASVDRLRHAVGEPMVVAGVSVRVGASVGAVPAGAGADPAALLAEADRRMYERKRARRRPPAAPSPAGSPA